ncbi:MAG: DUF4124 domain-containing protein [Oceanobacter sp.]
MKRSFLNPILIILTVLASSYSSATLAAKVYRWVDDKGQVHFGSQPPPEQRDQAEQYQIQVAQPTTPPAPENNGAASKDKDNDGEGETVTLNPSVSDEQAQEYCQQARKFMTALQGSYSTRFKQADGSFRPLSKEERSSKEKQAMGMMEKFCK